MTQILSVFLLLTFVQYSTSQLIYSTRNYEDINRLSLLKRIEELNTRLHFEPKLTVFDNVANSTNITNLCLANYYGLITSSSMFFDCAMKNARPFRLCRNCLLNYTNVVEARNLLMNDTNIYATSLFKNGLSCQDIIYAADRVQLPLVLSNAVDQIWDASKCDDCFKDDIQVFDTLHSQLQTCIQNFTKKPISMDPIFQNYSANCSLCSTCKNYYMSLSKHFTNMSVSTEHDENNMCMDIVDLFNYTRIAWSRGYECNYRDMDEMNVLIISGSFLVATIVFYITVRLIVQEEKRQIIQIPRKKSFVGSTSSFAQLG